MYANQPYTRGQWNEYVLYDKGHLVPRKTYSDTLERLLSTYTYTNVVPQHHSFNVGMWSTFEGKIREYASDPGHCVSDGGTLYLLTGTAFVHHAHPGNPTHPALLRLGGQNTGIHIPNSLWTAGCCVRPNNDAASFAIIGNNIETPISCKLHWMSSNKFFVKTLDLMASISSLWIIMVISKTSLCFQEIQIALDYSGYYKNRM